MAEAEDNVWATMTSPRELQGRKELKREKRDPRTINLPERRRDPNPSSQEAELVLNPNATKGVEINSCCVVENACSQIFEKTQLTARVDDEIGLIID